ncbi:MAG: hypothetical protein CVU63_01650 [Deltaproteobacteria bacterium HGW-Deltaproteobacteria-20]|nr:MAG: hypothetical protein CVU63_01650 [Deltaproteobacteria bacterium HGW-Deltaproteobacteria-20]
MDAPRSVDPALAGRIPFLIDKTPSLRPNGPMPCTPERLLELLSEGGFRYWTAPNPADGCLVAFMGNHATRPTIIVHVRMDSDGAVLTAMVTAFLRVSDHPSLPVLMQAMLHEAYLTNLGQWEMDPSDGEVRVTVQLPLFDAEPTVRQVGRTVTAAAHLADRAWPRLLAILETGEDPVLEEEVDDPARRELRRLQIRMQELLRAQRTETKHN